LKHFAGTYALYEETGYKESVYKHLSSTKAASLYLTLSFCLTLDSQNVLANKAFIFFI